jgi:hypothetical protein
MAPGEEQVLHRLLQQGFDALWPPGNAASHGQGNEPMDQASLRPKEFLICCSRFICNPFSLFLRQSWELPLIAR